MLLFWSGVTISIHAPLAGSDAHPLVPPHFLDISIHAPLAGSDVQRKLMRGEVKHFNPRSPCGERLGFRLHSRSSSGFQSTLPLRGATTGQGLYTERHGFQSTLPLRGATNRSVLMHFMADISIHAPLAGSDHVFVTYATFTRNFNPRSPCGERPTFRQNMAACRISIHAPLAGSDLETL